MELGAIYRELENMIYLECLIPHSKLNIRFYHLLSVIISNCYGNCHNKMNLIDITVDTDFWLSHHTP